MSEQIQQDNVARPLITLALFAYNQEDFVSEAIAGALSQTYGPLEIIISDDCSTDRTAEIIEEAIRSYKGPHRVDFVRNAKNLGLAGSVNNVLYNHSAGEWIVMAAGDDVSLPDRVELLWERAASDAKIKAVHSAASRVDERGTFLDVVRPASVSLEKIELGGILGAVAAYHRDTIDMFPPLDPNVGNEDMVFSLRALLLGEVAAVEDQLVLWRRHSRNISGNFRAGALERLQHQYGPYLKANAFSNLQQLRDCLAAPAATRFSAPVLDRLQGRILKRVEKSLRLHRFCGSLFSGKPIDVRDLLDPRNIFELAMIGLRMQSVSLKSRLRQGVERARLRRV